jgi:hypothetical protein
MQYFHRLDLLLKLQESVALSLTGTGDRAAFADMTALAEGLVYSPEGVWTFNGAPDFPDTVWKIAASGQAR